MASETPPKHTSAMRSSFSRKVGSPSRHGRSPSAANPKFAHHCRECRSELRVQSGTRIIELLVRSEEHTSELQSRFGISYAVFCLKKKKTNQQHYKATDISCYIP